MFQWSLEVLPIDTSALVRAGAPGSAAEGEEEDDDADSIDEEMTTTDAQLLRDVCCALGRAMFASVVGLILLLF